MYRYLFKKDSYKSQFVKVKQLNKNNNIATYETVNRKRFTVFFCLKMERRTHGRRKKRYKKLQHKQLIMDIGKTKYTVNLHFKKA